MGAFDGVGLSILRDGTVVRVTKVMPADQGRVLAFLRGLSPEDRSELIGDDRADLATAAARMTDPAGNDSVGILVSVRGQRAILGYGAYTHADLGRARVVFAVAPEHRRRGVGSVVLRHLAWVALANGIRNFEATTRDRAGLELIRAWFQPTIRVDRDVFRLEFPVHTAVRRQTKHQAAAHATT